jgi:hypothetical protein
MDDFERMGALLRPVESPALSNLTPGELIALAREGYLSQIAVADPQTMRDQTVLFVDFNELNGQVGRTFRSIPPEESRSSRTCRSRTWTSLSSPTTPIQTGSFADPDSPRHGRRPDLPRSAANRTRLDERQDAREDVAELAPAPRIDEPPSSLHRVP